MKVKISEKILCIPPYISTTWDQISFLQSEKDTESQRLTLLLQLIDGQLVKIPDLDPSLVEVVFSAHIQYLEKAQVVKKEEMSSKNGNLNFLPSPFNISPDQMAAFQIRLGNGMEGIENAFQHNPQQANSPSLPKELIDKIAAIAKILTNGDSASFPKPEPHCNCVHCQVARSIHNMSPVEESKEEEVVQDEDLKFRNWDILQTSEKLYIVTNPIDPKEQYNVYLGTPVGCTCGDAHCEHIRAVLTS